MTRRVALDGIAWWTPALPGWDLAAPALRGESGPAADTAAAPDATPARRPAPDLLPPNERRRAPDAVLLALQVAQAAVAASGHAAGALASVFCSAHGDLGVVDALCRTLASDQPGLLSPTRFHHSVHNAPSGYWAMAAGSQAPTTALAGFDRSFAAGLLEALALCTADEAPLLLVGTDTEACGALASVNRSRGLLGLALLLAPAAGPATRWTLDWALAAGPGAPPPLRSAAARAAAGNAQADALPLFEALAAGRPAQLDLALGADSHLRLRVAPALGHHPPTPSHGAAA
jgi:hypothetical protein